MVDWPKLVREEGPRVWRIAYGLLGNHADAADCVQETFAQVLEVSRREAVTTWPALLAKVATLEGLQRLRKRYREKDRFAGLAAGYEIVSPRGGPMEHAEAVELAQALRHALAGLPPQEAAVFSLRCLEDLSYQEIADQLHLRVNTVGVVLHRARARLRERLGAFLPGPA
jgi:RNA polymerase sigma-70 factor (ECF subfamily)